MHFFIDFENKIMYIMAPKSGTTTIANMLNSQHNNIDQKHYVNNPEYKKIIIIRKNVIDRFLSGFYEDLFAEPCYNNMNVTFDDYLLFLHKCWKEKIPNVNNLQIYNGLNIPVFFGKSLNITDNNGKFCSHIMCQKYSISNTIYLMECKNVQIIELNDLHILLPNLKKCNVKNKIDKLPDGIDNISNVTLSDIKSKILIIGSEFLNEIQKNLILDMYKEDIDYFHELMTKYTEFEL